ncbi:MAG: hypothetical protein ACXVNF_08870 [Neobacillus sp.]
MDIFDIEPVPVIHPFRNKETVLATPHIEYVTEETYKVFYQDRVKQLFEWLSSL